MLHILAYLSNILAYLSICIQQTANCQSMAPATVNFSCMTQQVDMTQQVEFQHVPRQANKSVYNIARHARHVSEFMVWMEDVLPHLVFLIQANSSIHQ